jgi:hypothetical protein
MLLWYSQPTIRTASMRKINSGELFRLQKSQEDTMFDICQIGTPSETVDSYGDVKTTYSYGSNVYCGFSIQNAYEKIDGEYVSVGTKTIVRLPITVTISNKSRIKHNDIEYDVVGISGKYSLVVNCEKVSV